MSSQKQSDAANGLHLRDKNSVRPLTVDKRNPLYKANLPHVFIVYAVPDQNEGIQKVAEVQLALKLIGRRKNRLCWVDGREFGI